MGHPATIKDIAKILDISVSTVSRALRNTYDVNPETKAKVMEVVVKLNYKPNYNAVGLAKGNSHNIGIILPRITNYYFSTVVTGIQEIAYDKGYNIVLFVTNDSPERELSITENLSTANIDGLLVSTSSNSDCCNHFQKLIDEGIPVVFFDRVPDNIRTSKVMQDDYYGAFAAVEHLIENGYTKIAHIAGHKGLTFTEKRLQGYIDALEKHHLPVRAEWIIYSGFSQECGENDAYQLLECEETPDAIFAVNDRKAIGSMIALKKRNISIGKDIGVVGFTNDPASTIISPSLTTMAEPAFDIGSKSCELLFKHIKKKNFIYEEVIIPGKLIIRESTTR
jgi:LacI family transcriptional regulator, galactose operon repressor